MIRVSVRRNRQSRPIAVNIDGHALFDTPGRDIVCAAVSMLVQTVVFALEDLVGLKPQLLMRQGKLQLMRPPLLSRHQDKEDKYYLLVEAMLLGLKETASAYPANLSYRERVRPGKIKKNSSLFSRRREKEI